MLETMPREAWTDERLDEHSTRTDEGFSEVKAEFRAVRTELGEMRAEIGQVREGLGEVRVEIKGINRTLQIGFGIIGSVLALITAMLLGLLGLIAT